MKKTAAVLAGIALAVVGVPAAASATEPTPGYVLVAWDIANPDAIWESPQTYITSVLLDAPSLDALDGSIPCGTYAQIDLYRANQDSAALIAGGVLYGPNNPTEPLAHGAVDGNPWKYLETAACVEEPTPRPFADSASTSDCEVTTTVTREGFFELDFDRVANVWTERLEPTITAEASSQAPVSAGEKSEACPVAGQLPTLADTGPEPLAWVIFGALTVLGLLLVAIDVLRRQTAPRYKRSAS